MLFKRKQREAPDASAAAVAEAPPEQVEAHANTEPATPLRERPLVKTGFYAWALVGILVVLVALGFVVAQLRLIVIPLVLALFPAAVLAPPTNAMKARRVPPALAALISIIGFFALLAVVVAVLAPQVGDELDGLTQSVTEGAQQLRRFLESGPFGLDPIRVDQLIDRGGQMLAETEGLGAGAVTAVVVVVEGVAGLLFGLVALFFYLKDGPKIGAWLNSLFPRRMRADIAEIADRAWDTVGAYIRGQVVIAFVDAVIIGIGLAMLQVPLALPLAVLVFFGALFPIVGAVVTGLVAVLVALATNGLITALLVLGLIVIVQQVEGDVLAPIVLGRATALHPLATLAALAAGAILLGILGAFLAIPITASATRAIGYLRQRSAPA